MAHLSLPVIFLANACLSFGLSLLLAFLLGPEGFGRYAIALSMVVVVNTTLFEWLRLSATRFYSEKARTERPEIRATLERACATAGILLVATTLLVLGLGLDLGLSAKLFAAAALCGLAYGICEYRMALARARFLGRSFAVLALGRGVLSFVFAAGLALATGDPALALIGMAAAAATVTLATRGALSDRETGAQARLSRRLLAGFARYGLPLVAANALYQMIPLVNRAFLASQAGFAEAGYFALASEIATRLFQNLGSALDLALFQLAVRAEETQGREAGERQINRNIAIVAAIVLPASFGLVLVWPAFEAIFAPAAFRGKLAEPILFLVPALAAFAMLQYAINPVFQLRGRTAPVVAAAVAALAVDLALVGLVPSLRTAVGFAMAQGAGMAAGMVVLAGLARAAGAALPYGDLMRVLLASALMMACLWPLRGALPPLPALVVLSGAGAALYGALALAFDIAGCRAPALRRISRAIGRSR